MQSTGKSVRSLLRCDSIRRPSSELSSIPLSIYESAGERIYIGREVDVKARLLTKPEPRYTADARKNNISGTVILKVIFAKTGEVKNIRVASGLPYGLTEEAINAARQIKFTPAMIDGTPVSMWMQLEYNFSPD